MATTKTKKVKHNKANFLKHHRITSGRQGVKAIATYNREELLNKRIDHRLVTDYITLNSHLTIKDLKDKLKYEKVSALEHMIVQAIINAALTGAPEKVDFILNRLIGKTPTLIGIAKLPNAMDEMSTEELIAEKLKIEEAIRDTLEYERKTSERFINQETIAHEYINTTSKRIDSKED